jgi:hypothetical protein
MYVLKHGEKNLVSDTRTCSESQCLEPYKNEVSLNVNRMTYNL